MIAPSEMKFKLIILKMLFIMKATLCETMFVVIIVLFEN